MGKGKKTYVVFEGRNPGIYDSWPDTHREVNRFPSNVHKSYRSSEEAGRAYDRYTEKPPAPTGKNWSYSTSGSK